MPAKCRGALEIMAAVCSLMTSARYSASRAGSQCDNSSGIGDSTCMSVPSSAISGRRCSTSHERASILRNTLPPIITAAPSPAELYAGPQPVARRIGRKSRRHDMGVNIDHRAQLRSPLLPLASLFCVIRTTLRASSAHFTLQTGLIVSNLLVKASFERRRSKAGKQLSLLPGSDRDGAVENTRRYRWCRTGRRPRGRGVACGRACRANYLDR